MKRKTHGGLTHDCISSACPSLISEKNSPPESEVGFPGPHPPSPNGWTPHPLQSQSPTRILIMLLSISDSTVHKFSERRNCVMFIIASCLFLNMQYPWCTSQETWRWEGLGPSCALERPTRKESRKDPHFPENPPFHAPTNTHNSRTQFLAQ